MRSARNKTKELSAVFEKNDIDIGVFVESWISNTSDDNFLLQRCCHQCGLKFYNASRHNKRGGWFCVCYRSDLPLENFGVFSSEYFECCFMIIRVAEIISLLIAKTTGGNFKSFIEIFAHFFEEKGLLYHRIFLLGDLNIFLMTTNDVSTLWNFFMEDFSSVQHVEGETHKIGGLIDHFISFINMCIEVTKNFFLTTSDHSVIHFSLNNLFVTKPTQQIFHRNWQKFISDVYVEPLLNDLKENHPEEVDSAWNNYLQAEESFLKTLIPRIIKTLTTQRCQCFDDELLNLKRKKNKSDHAFRKTKNLGLKSVFEINAKTYFQKFLQKRAIYFKKTQKNESARQKFN